MKVILIALAIGSDPWPQSEKADPWPVLAEENPPHVLLLTAEWCGPCQEWKKSEGKSLKDAGWRIREFDADRRQDLIARYGITGLPGFVVTDEDGSPKKTWNGRLGLRQFGEWFYGEAPKSESESETRQGVIYYQVQPKRKKSLFGGLIQWK